MATYKEMIIKGQRIEASDTDRGDRYILSPAFQTPGGQDIRVVLKETLRSAKRELEEFLIFQWELKKKDQEELAFLRKKKEEEKKEREEKEALTSARKKADIQAEVEKILHLEDGQEFTPVHLTLSALLVSSWAYLKKIQRRNGHYLAITANPGTHGPGEYSERYYSSESEYNVSECLALWKEGKIEVKGMVGEFHYSHLV